MQSTSPATNAPRRGPWSPAEDQRLLALIEDHGPSNWVRISQMLATRTPKQCRERFHQNLKPTLNHEPITDEEGLYIEQLVAQYGKKWAEIARHLNGRSDNAVKNWWNGGANRRRRASVALEHHHHPMQQQQQQQQQPSGAHSQSMHAPPPGPLSAGHPQLPQHPGHVPPHMYQYPSVGHRVSLPNIHSTEYQRSPFAPQQQQQAPMAHAPAHHHIQPPGPMQHSAGGGGGGGPTSPFGSQAPYGGGPPSSSSSSSNSGVIFNSAYTSDSSSGFGRSLSVSGPSNSIDPHHKSSPRPLTTSSSNGHSHPPPTFGRRRGNLDEIFPNTPYSRRVSINTTSTGYSSSRASSIGGVSSASDNEDPLHSLSKYSLSNSTSTSRRNSAVPPQVNDAAVLPPLGSPTSNGSNNNNNNNNSSTPTSTTFNTSYAFGMAPRVPVTTPPPPPLNGPTTSFVSQHRHSITGYPSPRMNSFSGPVIASTASNATSRLAETNTNNGSYNDSTTPTPKGGSPIEPKNEMDIDPKSMISNNHRLSTNNDHHHHNPMTNATTNNKTPTMNNTPEKDQKLKISNLLS